MSGFVLDDLVRPAWPAAEAAAADRRVMRCLGQVRGCSGRLAPASVRVSGGAGAARDSSAGAAKEPAPRRGAGWHGSGSVPGIRAEPGSGRRPARFRRVMSARPAARSRSAAGLWKRSVAASGRCCISIWLSAVSLWTTARRTSGSSGHSRISARLFVTLMVITSPAAPYGSPRAWLAGARCRSAATAAGRLHPGPSSECARAVVPGRQ
jgi:hypothetical protein